MSILSPGLMHCGDLCSGKPLSRLAQHCSIVLFAGAMAKKSPTGFLLCSALFLSTAFVGSPSPKLPARQLSVRKSSEDAALATVADAGASPLLAPLKVASLGMGLLKPIFAAEAKLQALSYDEAEIQAKIQEEVKSAPVVVYTYGLSPFCTEATKLLDSIGAEYKEIQLAPEWFLMLGENAAKRAELGAIYGRASSANRCLDVHMT